MHSKLLLIFMLWWFALTCLLSLALSFFPRWLSCVFLSIHLSVVLLFGLSVCLSVCLSFYCPSVCLSVYLSLLPWFPPVSSAVSSCGCVFFSELYVSLSLSLSSFLLRSLCLIFPPPPCLHLLLITYTLSPHLLLHTPFIIFSTSPLLCFYPFCQHSLSPPFPFSLVSFSFSPLSFSFLSFSFFPLSSTSSCHSDTTLVGSKLQSDGCNLIP